MKIIVFFAVCMLIFLSAIVFSVDMLKNPNFFMDNAVITGWAANGNVKITSQGGYGNKSCAVLESDNNISVQSLGQSVKINSSYPHLYEFSAWYKCSSDIDDFGDLWLYSDIFYRDGTNAWGPYIMADRNNKNWQKLTLKVIPTKPVDRVDLLILYRNSKGRVLVSAPEFKEIAPQIISLGAERLADSKLKLNAYYDFPANYVIKALNSKSNPMEFSGFDRKIDIVLPANCDNIKIISNNKFETSKNIAVKKYNYTYWTDSSFNRVFLDDVKPFSASNTIKLECARGEYESAQIALRAVNQDLSNISVEMPDLKNGQNVILKTNLCYNILGYVNLSEQAEQIIPDGEYRVSTKRPQTERLGTNWWGDILLNNQSFSVKSGETQPVWFTFYIPKDTVPGVYKGNVIITGDGIDNSIKIPINIKVHDFIIPDKTTIKTAFATMDGFIKKFHKTDLTVARHNYIDYLSSHRLNFDDITRADIPDINDLKYQKDRGGNYYTLLNVAEKAKPEDDWVCFMELPAYDDAFIERFMTRLEEIYPKLESAGLLENAYVYGFDERQAEYRPVIKKIFGLIKERFPKLKTITTAMFYDRVNPADYNVDAYVPIVGLYNKKQHMEFVNSGGEMWWYVCGANNFHIEAPLVEGRLLFWQTYLYDIKGLLYWGTNVWDRADNNRVISSDEGNKIIWDTSTGSCHGDGRMLYPGENNMPLGSPRIDAIRDGIEETEIIFAYEKAFGKTAAHKLVKSVTSSTVDINRDLKHVYKIKAYMLSELDSLK